MESLDVVKWVSALLIIIIHTNPFREIEVLDFYIKEVLARIAVPMFFAISGFLSSEESRSRMGKSRDHPRISYFYFVM